MKSPVFTGAGVAIVTPFNEDSTVNFEKLGELIEFQIANGTKAIIICGTTGEASALDDNEHKECIEYCIKKVAARVPVIAGTGSNDTAYALQLSQFAQSAGADALLHVTPYYNKTTQSGLVKHFTYIADRVSIPIILYNVPSRTGMSFTADTYKALSAHPNINGVKEASGNFTLIAQTVSLCGDDLNIWSGNDDQVIPIMALGGLGVISVASNIVPALVCEMCEKYLSGDTKGAADIQTRFFDLFNELFLEVNPIPIKTAMGMKKMISPILRMPLCEMGAANAARLGKTLTRFGIL